MRYIVDLYNEIEIFEEWLKSPEGKQSLATGEYAQEYTREQGLRLAFLLGIKTTKDKVM